MPHLSPYIITKTDYFGQDYQTTVFLTPKEASERIVDGRLISVSAARQRNYSKLWDKFKESELKAAEHAKEYNIYDPKQTAPLPTDKYNAYHESLLNPDK